MTVGIGHILQAFFIIDLYNKLFTEEWPKNSKESFVLTVSQLAIGEKTMYSSNTNGWALYRKYDRKTF